MTIQTKTAANADTLTAVTLKNQAVVLTSIAEAGQGSQCHCDAGLVWRYGKAQPCHKCKAGARMFQAQAASDYMEIYG